MALNKNQDDSLLMENLERLQVSPVAVRDILQTRNQDRDISLNIGDQPFLRVDGKDLYPPQDTLRQVASEAAGLVRDQEADLVVFFGLGLGLHLQFIRKFSDAPLVVFEPDPGVINTVLECLPLDLERTTLVSSPGYLAELVQALLEHAPRGMIVGALPAWVKQNPVSFGQFKGALEQASRKLEIDRNTLALFSAQWIHNIAANLPRLASVPDWTALGDHFRNRPAILVGAGPSLDKNLDQLREIQGRALICAAHTTVMPLVQAGIFPDLVAIIEGQDLRHYFNDLEGLNRMTLVPVAQSHPAHLDVGFERLMTMTMANGAAADWMQKAYGLTPLATGPSVACISFSLLYALGCDPLVLVGMDCALTDNRSHCSGSIQGATRLVETTDDGRGKFEEKATNTTGEWNIQEVEAYGGHGTVLTRTVFSTYRNWLEGGAQTWGIDRTLINATEGGARIGGFQELSLAEVKDRYCRHEFSAQEIIGQALAQAPGRDPVLLAEALEGELVWVGKAALAAGKVHEEGRVVLEFFAANRLSQVQAILDKLGEKEKKLQSLTRRTRLLNTLVGYRARDLAKDTAPAEDEISLTIHSVKQSLAIAGLVSEGARELEDLFRPVVQSLRRMNGDTGQSIP